MKAEYAASCGVEWECVQDAGSLENGAVGGSSKTLDLTGCPSGALRSRL